MKRFVIGAIFVLLCGAALFAQFKNADGFYFAQDANFTNNQKNQAVIEVKGGKIVSAKWNILSLAAGTQDLKAVAASGTVPAAANWADQAKAAEDSLVSGQAIPKSPAANVKPFFDLADKALKSKAVAKGSYGKDGWFYALDSEKDEYNTQNYVIITVVNGTIVDVLWNGVLVGYHSSVNPSKMLTSRANAYPMTGSRRAWHIQAEAATAELVKVQNIDSIKMKTDGKHPDAISGVTIEINGFITATKMALQAAK